MAVRSATECLEPIGGSHLQDFLFAEILHEAEELWQRQSNSGGSDSSSEVGSVASGSTGTGSAVMTDFNEHYIHASRIIQAAQAAKAAEQAMHNGVRVILTLNISFLMEKSRIGPRSLLTLWELGTRWRQPLTK